jgi:hypothetical protein
LLLSVGLGKLQWYMPRTHAPGVLICAVVGENASRVNILCVLVCHYFCRLYHSPMRAVGPYCRRRRRSIRLSCRHRQLASLIRYWFLSSSLRRQTSAGQSDAENKTQKRNSSNIVKAKKKRRSWPFA